MSRDSSTLKVFHLTDERVVEVYRVTRKCAPQTAARGLRSEVLACYRQQGFTLVEVLMAVLLLSVMALSLTQTLIAAQQARTVSVRWTQAAQLAAEGIEQLRAGHTPGPITVSDTFDRRTEVTAWNGHDRLFRLKVTVSWNDGSAHDFQLTTLARR